MTRAKSLSWPELGTLYSDGALAEIAALLKVQSVQGRDVLKEQILYIAMHYSTGTASAEKPISNHELGKALKKIQKHVDTLAIALHQAHGFVRSTVGDALSMSRPERRLLSGEPVLPYGHPSSNEWIFARENYMAFMTQLHNIRKHLMDQQSVLAKPGHPKGPETEVVEGLRYLWTTYRRQDPKPSDLLKLCELVLKPVAQWHEKSPSFESAAKVILYGRKPPRKS
jgi:hypothetical protein